MTWEPYTRAQVERIVEEQLLQCTPEQAAMFEQHRVPLRLAPIERYGKDERVFVVAQRGKEVLYWEDVEEGFNTSPIDESGRILEHWCSQDELTHVMYRWIHGHNDGLRRGPAS